MHYPTEGSGGLERRRLKAPQSTRVNVPGLALSTAFLTFPAMRFDRRPVDGGERYHTRAILRCARFCSYSSVLSPVIGTSKSARSAASSNFAVLQTDPAHIRNGERLVMGQERPQVMFSSRRTLRVPGDMRGALDWRGGRPPSRSGHAANVNNGRDRAKRCGRSPGSFR
jgi:hypothetical protein